MRIRESFRFTVTTGSVVICDPGYQYPYKDSSPYVEVPSNVQIVENFGGDGSFSVYSDSEYIIVDTAPRLFKSKTRKGLVTYKDKVDVDSGMICFIDSNEESMKNFRGGQDGYVKVDMPNGEYCIWREQHETSMSNRDSIVCFGKAPCVFLAGSNGNTINELEKDAATYFRTKGRDKNTLLKNLESKISEIYLSGSNDVRLKLLANTLGVQLPSRKKNAKAP